MTLRLNGSSSGYTEIDAPAAAGSNTLTLPTGNGSPNQFIKNGSTAGELEYSSMVETSTGGINIGTSTPRTNLVIGSLSAQLQVEGTDHTTSSVSLIRNSNDTSQAFLTLGKSRGTALNSNTIVQDGDGLGAIAFLGNDGTSFPRAAEISAKVDGTPGTNDMPGRLVFETTADGAANPTERMRLTKDGALYVGETSGGITAHDNGRGCVKARGYNTKQGVSNALGNNAFNIFWTGSQPQLWIDNSNIGVISTTSDYRVKDNVTPILDGSIDRIKQLRPVQYQYTNYEDLFTADGVTREGFIAHEVAEVIPSGVEGEKDDPNQIQSLKLDAILSVTVKALQEAVAKIETLETKVAALEAGS